jgi:myosin heavy subunit
MPIRFLCFKVKPLILSTPSPSERDRLLPVIEYLVNNHYYNVLYHFSSGDFEGATKEHPSEVVGEFRSYFQHPRLQAVANVYLPLINKLGPHYAELLKEYKDPQNPRMFLSKILSQMITPAKPADFQVANSKARLKTCLENIRTIKQLSAENTEIILEAIYLAWFFTEKHYDSDPNVATKCVDVLDHVNFLLELQPPSFLLNKMKAILKNYIFRMNDFYTKLGFSQTSASEVRASQASTSEANVTVIPISNLSSSNLPSLLQEQKMTLKQAKVLAGSLKKQLSGIEASITSIKQENTAQSSVNSVAESLERQEADAATIKELQAKQAKSDKKLESLIKKEEDSRKQIEAQKAKLEKARIAAEKEKRQSVKSQTVLAQTQAELQALKEYEASAKANRKRNKEALEQQLKEERDKVKTLAAEHAKQVQALEAKLAEQIQALKLEQVKQASEETQGMAQTIESFGVQNATTKLEIEQLIQAVAANKAAFAELEAQLKKSTDQQAELAKQNAQLVSQNAAWAAFCERTLQSNRALCAMQLQSQGLVLAEAPPPAVIFRAREPITGASTNISMTNTSTATAQAACSDPSLRA